MCLCYLCREYLFAKENLTRSPLRRLNENNNWLNLLGHNFGSYSFAQIDQARFPLLQEVVENIATTRQIHCDNDICKNNLELVNKNGE